MIVRVASHDDHIIVIINETNAYARTDLEKNLRIACLSQSPLLVTVIFLSLSLFSFLTTFLKFFR